MESINKKKWEDLNLTRDELNNFGQALKQEEFRNLLLEYVKEINDPENRKQYENDITQLENERGNEVKFVHPTSGYVIKTSVDGKLKAFINICSNSNVGSPSSFPGTNEGQHGLQWSIPYCLAPPREDYDKKKNACTVFDVVFHPDTLHMTKTNAPFKKLVEDTALNGIEDNFNVSLDKVNLKYPKMEFKGAKQATVIRKKIENFQSHEEVLDIPNYPYPPPSQENTDAFKAGLNKSKMQSDNCSSSKKASKDSQHTTPKYSIKYRSNVDIQNYTNDPMSKMMVTVPNEIVVNIDLPLLKCSTDANIDVTEKSLTLVSNNTVKYKLQLNLPYIVDKNKGNAKYDIDKKVLTVTLPVVSVKSNSLDVTTEDSGVECDNWRSNSVSSSDDDLKNESLETKHCRSVETPKDVPITKDCEDHKINPNLNSKVHYSLPNFGLSLVNNELVVTLEVPNVNPDSVQHSFLKHSAGFHISFLSMGTGYFPVNYAMCLKIPDPTEIVPDAFCVEVWDNNVIAQVKLMSCHNQVLDVFIGTEESNLKTYVIHQDLGQKGKSSNALISTTSGEDNLANGDVQSIETPGIRKDKLSHENLHESEKTDGLAQTFSTQDEGKSVLAAVETLTDHVKDMSVSGSGSESSFSPQHRHFAKSRTHSESYRGESARRTRGILKVGRSLSESSVDEYASWSDEKAEKTKKTVRFSDVIYKQTFRMNSSILGQRKKNQKKLKYKKRAQERRVSESGCESEGDSETSSICKNSDVWFKDADSSSCEASEVSEVSDVSESDDGQKEGAKVSMPCSNKINHKRRGKKSARKNAATAKIQFMNH